MIKSSVYDKPQKPLLFEIRLCHSYSKFFFERTSKSITCLNVLKAGTKVKNKNQKIQIEILRRVTIILYSIIYIAAKTKNRPILASSE